MELAVRIKKNLREFVLDVNFVTRNEVFALLGASGCGKSMTLKCIAGIEKPDSGRIVLNGRVLYDSEQKINLSPQNRRVGYLFQNYALFPNMTVAENILFSAVGDDKNQRLSENLERFGLNGLENAYPLKLSGGQQQRVALARILMSHAEILLLDEPFSAIDSYMKWQLELNLTKVLPAYDGAAILVSHDRGEVFRLAKKIAVMTRGRIDTINTKTELFRNPKTLAATLLTGCKNVSAAKKIDSRHIFAEDWQLALTTAEDVPNNLKYVGVRAHLLKKLSAQDENVFAMEIVQRVEDINSQVFMVRLKDSAAMPLRWDAEKNFGDVDAAEEIYLQLPADKLILLEG